MRKKKILLPICDGCELTEEGTCEGNEINCIAEMAYNERVSHYHLQGTVAVLTDERDAALAEVAELREEVELKQACINGMVANEKKWGAKLEKAREIASTPMLCESYSKMCQIKEVLK